MADSSLMKLTLQVPDGKRVSFHVDEETYRLVVDEKDEDTIRYLVSQTVYGEQDSGIVLADYDSSDVPATEDQSVDASSVDSRTADSGAATASASGVRWTHEGILLMLSLYEEHKQKFDSTSFKNKNVWRLIAEEMAHKGVTVTGEACDSKFRLMKFKYKKIVDQHATSGSGRKSWEYFQRMDELFAGDPSVRPAMVVSSMPVQQDVTVTVTAKPPPGPRRPTVHKEPTPPPIDQPAGRATTPSTEVTDELVATPHIRKRKRSGSQDPPEWFRSYMLEHSQRLDRLDAHNERLTALAEQKNRLLERLVEALISNKS